jgi:hypothetical protein
VVAGEQHTDHHGHPLPPSLAGPPGHRQTRRSRSRSRAARNPPWPSGDRPAAAPVIRGLLGPVLPGEPPPGGGPARRHEETPPWTAPPLRVISGRGRSPGRPSRTTGRMRRTGRHPPPTAPRPPQQPPGRSAPPARPPRSRRRPSGRRPTTSRCRTTNRCRTRSPAPAAASAPPPGTRSQPCCWPAPEPSWPGWSRATTGVRPGWWPFPRRTPPRRCRPPPRRCPCRCGRPSARPPPAGRPRRAVRPRVPPRPPSSCSAASPRSPYAAATSAPTWSASRRRTGSSRGSAAPAGRSG